MACLANSRVVENSVLHISQYLRVRYNLLRSVRLGPTAVVGSRTRDRTFCCIANTLEAWSAMLVLDSALSRSVGLLHVG